MVESANGAIQVIELDPTKWYWIVATPGALHHPVRFRNGNIFLRHADQEISFVENTDRVTGEKEAPCAVP